MPSNPDREQTVADPTVVSDPSRPRLPAGVAEVLARRAPDPGRRTTTIAAGIPYSALEWGSPAGRPLVLVHGVVASARVWWLIGPALAMTGRRVIAVDQAGHGSTRHWQGHHRFRDNAADVAAWIRARELDRPDLQVVGHSWGAMTVAALPANGIRPATLVLVDGPAIPYAAIAQMVSDPSEQPIRDLQEAIAVLAVANPTWGDEDVRAKAEALGEVEIDAARAILLENGDFDGGLSELRDPASAGIDTWIVRGDPAAGGLVPDAAVPALAACVGDDHVLTIPGAGHSPQRSHPAELTAALLTALG